MNAVRHLVNAQQAYQALLSLWPQIKAHILAGHRLELEVRPERRNTAQNALLHALLEEIAVRAPWAGELRDKEVWKRLMTAAWLRAEGESVEMYPAVDGKGMDIVYQPTHTLSKTQMASLVDYVTAWMVEQGIELTEVA